MKYISEQLTGELVSDWRDNYNVIVTAPTGSGKTMWVKNVLTKHYSNILILVNRAKLRSQLKDEFENSGIDIGTYQYVESCFRKGKPLDLNKYDAVVCDEAHYFISDSGFNHFTDISLNQILNAQTLKIFMSATIEDLEEYFNETGVSIDDIQYFDFNLNISKVYTYKETNLLIKYFNTIEHKSLMFSNVDKLQSINSLIDDSNIIVSDYNRKNYLTNKNEADSIVNNNKFHSKILLTTTTLDNGISIKDLNVKSIVVDLYDPITIKQAIGRLRVESSDQALEIVIGNKSKSSVSATIRTMEDTLLGVEILRESEEEYLATYNRITYNHKRCIYPDVDVDGRTKMCINEIALFKLQKDLNFLYIVRKGLEDKSGDFASHIIEYLGIGDVELKKLKDVFDMENVDLILSKFENKFLFKEDKEELSSQLKPYIVDLESRRKVKSFNLTFLNEYLIQFEHIYTVEEKRVRRDGKQYRVWVVNKLEEVDV